MPASSKQRIEAILLVSIACGATVENAAAKANVTTKTVQRHTSDPEFQRRLRELKDGMVKRAAAMLTAAAMEGIRTLTALLDRENPPAVRLGAARAIIELGVRLRESADLHERLTVLEQNAVLQDQPVLPTSVA